MESKETLYMLKMELALDEGTFVRLLVRCRKKLETYSLALYIITAEVCVPA